ncbi:GH18227 [Drosophila grimshawi]|uniref:GH18227 n=2 Tax=Drosophila grimshawi TaxID=7222 RepID=B4JFQ9_DROGR|nr:GH18227 [Drosophila grimshawi]
MPEIVQQMHAWNLELKEDDGRPQYMCIACIAEFQKLLKFKRNCLETQEQFEKLDIRRDQNGVVIKQEIAEANEQTFCGFIYLDTDDEEEEDEEAGIAEDGSRRVWAPLDIPHMPIKEEHTARVPHETQYHQQPIVGNLSEEAIFAQVKPEELAYDEAVITLPTTMQEPGVFCKMCGHASATQAKHTEHMNRIHMLKNTACHICGKKFTNALESRVRFHMKWHKLQKHVKCPMCGFFCSSKDTLKEHKIAEHTRCKCEFCGKILKHKNQLGHLNRHLQEYEEELARKLGSMQTMETATVKTQLRLIGCAFCDETFEDAEQLQTHVQHKHRTVPPEERYTTEEESLTVTTTGQLPASDTCKPAAQSESSHPESDRTSTQRGNVSMCECNICGKTFNLQIKLNRHLRLHSKSPF